MIKVTKKDLTVSAAVAVASILAWENLGKVLPPALVSLYGPSETCYQNIRYLHFFGGRSTAKLNAKGTPETCAR
jgi:hypothetical protein